MSSTTNPIYRLLKLDMHLESCMRIEIAQGLLIYGIYFELDDEDAIHVINSELANCNPYSVQPERLNYRQVIKGLSLYIYVSYLHSSSIIHTLDVQKTQNHAFYHHRARRARRREPLSRAPTWRWFTSSCSNGDMPDELLSREAHLRTRIGKSPSPNLPFS
jgi:hypothetical protein